MIVPPPLSARVEVVVPEISSLKPAPSWTTAAVMPAAASAASLLMLVARSWIVSALV